MFDRFVYINGDGELEEGIAKEWSISDDGLTYEFKIKDDIYWQDGTKLSIEDVFFTFEIAKVLAEEYSFDSVGISLIGIEFQKSGKDTIRFNLEMCIRDRPGTRAGRRSARRSIWGMSASSQN